MTGHQLIDHKGIQICYMDFSNLKSIQVIDEIIQNSKIYIQSQPTSSVYCLTNLENIHFNSEVNKMFTEFVKGNKEHVKSSAICGLNGLTRIMFNGLMKVTGRDLRSFNTEEDAKDFLASQK
jgi:hypothetical protein